SGRVAHQARLRAEGRLAGRARLWRRAGCHRFHCFCRPCGLLVVDMSAEATLTLTLENRDEAVPLFGSRDQYLRLIRDGLEVRIIARGNTIQVEGADNRVAEADRVFQQLRQMLRQQGKLTPEDVRTVLAIVQQG